MAFTNNTHKHITDAFIETSKSLLEHPYYLFTNQRATPVDYLNINTKLSTLDDSSKLSNNYFGKENALRFNYIKGFFLYGIEKIVLTLDNTEDGLTGQDITGEALILPGTIQPYPNDYFLINHLNKQFLFQVTEVQRDTLENNANYWKIDYRLERVLSVAEATDLKNNIADVYDFYVTNVGTDFKSVIKRENGEVLEILDQVNTTLQLFFRNLFYSNAVQTFVAPNPFFTENQFYDNMMIEFLRRNEILKDEANHYLYIDHKINLPATFGIDYANTLYRAFEAKDLENIGNYKYISVPSLLREKFSIFATRPNKYFQLDYKAYGPNYLNGLIKLNDLLDNGQQDGSIVSIYNPINPSIYILPDEVMNAIKSNTLFTDDHKEFNLFVKYFNDGEINPDDIAAIESIPYSDYDFSLFFTLPLLLFCIQYYIKKILR